MLPTQRTTIASRSTLTTSVLARATSSSSTSTNPASGSNTQPANGGGALLVSLDAFSRESLLGQQGTAWQPANDNTTTQSTTAKGSVNSGAADSASSNLDKAVQGMQQNLQSLASDPAAFHSALARSFGDTYDKPSAEQIRQQTLVGDFSWMPEVRVVDSAMLTDQSGTQGSGTGLGAYSAENDTIYISADLLSSDPEGAVSLLTEEVGHALDVALNTHDAAGDEGDIFARVVGGEQISDSDLTALRAENDGGTIIVDGKEVEVEYGFSFSKAIKGVTNAVKSVGKAIGGAVDSVTGAIKDTVDNVVDTVKDVGRRLENGFRAVINSPIVSAIMSVAQYIPIPIVAAVATVYNAVRAGYQVFHGLRHGSIGTVLGGVAGLAGGAAKLGDALGVSQTFIDGATRIGDAAGKAAQLYHATAAQDFTTALSIASEMFKATSAGTLLHTAQQASDVRDAVRSGDLTAALSQAATMAKAGDYTAAAAGLLTRYGDQLGIDGTAQANILNVTQALANAGDLRKAVRSDDYSTVLQSVAETLVLPINEDTLAMLDSSMDIRDAVRSEDFGAAAQSAAVLASQSGRPVIAARFEQLAELLGSGKTGESDSSTPPYVRALTTQGA